MNEPPIEPEIPEQPAPAEPPIEERPPGVDFPGFADWDPAAMEAPASHERVPGDAGPTEPADDPPARDLHENLFGERDALPDLRSEPEPLSAGGEPAVLPGQDSLLEATPDFFEETAEYDKMWFEEKPPKDFDFNE